MSWDSKKAFSDSVRRAFPAAIIYDKTGDYKSVPYIADLQTAERFLQGGGQTYDALRAFLPDMVCCQRRGFVLHTALRNIPLWFGCIALQPRRILPRNIQQAHDC